MLAGGTAGPILHLHQQEMFLLRLFQNDGKAAKVLRTAALAVLAGAAIYALSPTVQNQFGSVPPPEQRVPSSELIVRTLGGEDWSLAGRSGEVVLVNFWATWCPPRRIETPALVALHNRYAQQGFTVAGVTLDDDPQSTVPGFVRRYQMGYPVLVPAGDFPMLATVEALPTSILLDRAGRIARTYRGMVTERGLRDDIEALLSEPAPPVRATKNIDGRVQREEDYDF